jgi:hypothetical protein
MLSAWPKHLEAPSGFQNYAHFLHRSLASMRLFASSPIATSTASRFLERSGHNWFLWADGRVSDCKQTVLLAKWSVPSTYRWVKKSQLSDLFTRHRD